MNSRVLMSDHMLSLDFPCAHQAEEANNCYLVHFFLRATCWPVFNALFNAWRIFSQTEIYIYIYIYGIITYAISKRYGPITCWEIGSQKMWYTLLLSTLT